MFFKNWSRQYTTINAASGLQLGSASFSYRKQYQETHLPRLHLLFKCHRSAVWKSKKPKDLGGKKKKKTIKYLIRFSSESCRCSYFYSVILKCSWCEGLTPYQPLLFACKHFVDTLHWPGTHLKLSSILNSQPRKRFCSAWNEIYWKLWFY